MSQEPTPTDEIAALPQSTGEAVHYECEEAAIEIAALRRELEELVSWDVNDEPDDIVDSILGRGLEITNRLRELGEKV